VKRVAVKSLAIGVATAMLSCPNANGDGILVFSRDEDI
jgi:hypothetical protein